VDRSKLERDDIFCAAIELASPAERAAYLDQVCGDDLDTRRRVERLLEAHSQAGSFLGARPAIVATTTDLPAESSGSPIGPYKLLQEIGTGGMGVVWMAEQTRPVQRKVALKIIKAGMDSRQVLARFEAERQALALMDHPNIAKVFDGGATAAGRPFFVMELVKGQPITQYCDEHRLTPRQRLELFVPVCQAIQHAHQKGIIHRDVKPSNVLVAPYDGKPVVKVIDFGVAKATGQRLTEKTLFTELGAVVGTLEYMSPEQAELNNQDIDTRSDIYALGVLLYELLTGSTPLTRQQLKQAAFSEMLRLIREEEPPKPSTRLSDSKDSLPSISAQRHTEPAKLTKLVRGELDWIVMKALEKDRNRRYETANGFAQDLQRYLADEPVQACPPSAWYRFHKFTQRHKAGLRIAAAAALVLLLAIAGVSWALWDQAARRTELAERMAETEWTVSAALVQTEQWRKQAGDAPIATSQEADAVLALWRQAEASLAQAETALRTGTADDRLRQQVMDERQQIEQGRAQAQRTAKLFRDLDDARMTQSIWIETHWDYASASTKYAAAFAAYGLEVKPGPAEELARRIRAEQPAIREALIVALENWCSTAASAKTAELANLVLAIAAAADDDPWRRQFRAAASAGDVTSLRALSRQARRLCLPPSSLLLLAARLSSQGDLDEAVTLLRWARGRHLTDFWIHFDLGARLRPDDDKSDKSPKILEEAIGCYRTALALRPAAVAAHNNLGLALLAEKQLDEAIAECRKAIELNPKFARAHTSLGLALQANNLLNEAMVEYRKAIDLDPKFAPAHNGLGNALMAKNQLDEAMGEYRKAIALDPRFAPAHSNLGNALMAKNQLDEAIAECRRAIELNPKLARPHHNLGNALMAKNQLGEAIAEYRKAMELDPELAVAHIGLGNALEAKNLLNEAMAEYRKAIDLDPKLAPAHSGLGAILCDVKHDYDGAIIEFRQCIELDPKEAMFHNNLGNALRKKNQLDEASAEFRKAIDLDPKLALAPVASATFCRRRTS